MERQIRNLIFDSVVMLMLGLAPAMFAQAQHYGNSDLIEETYVENTGDLFATDDLWNFEVTPFVWALSLDADLTVKGKSVLVDLDFSDIWDDLDFGGMLQLRASNGEWILQFNGMYAKLGIDGSINDSKDFTKEIVIVGEIEKQLFFRDFVIDFERDISIDIPERVKADISVDIEIAIAEFFVGYELFTVPLDGFSRNPYTQREATFIIAPFGGIRYTSFQADLDLHLKASIGKHTTKAFIEVDDSESWIDPVIGIDFALVDLGQWSFGVRGDIGGFGIADGSDLVWSLGGRAMFQVSPNFAIWCGYYILDYDYSTGSGADKFALNGRFEGPILGGGFMF